MITENLSTLKINKLSQKQYDRELAAGKLNENEIYLTPDSSITLWQPNTEYKVGDVVIENFDNGYMGNPRTGVLQCVKNHTSSDYFSQDYLGDSKWEQKKDVWAEYGYRDYLGNLIPETYATKDELAKAIGQALEGDY